MQRSDQDLRQGFVDTLSNLRDFCHMYDRGSESMGKPMAAALRLLLHSKGRATSQIRHLKLEDINFYDSCGPLDPDNVLTMSGLTDVCLRFGSDSPAGAHSPACHAMPRPNPPRWISFDAWWRDNPVAIDANNCQFSRADLVLSVAEKDDGAHSDREFPPGYAGFSREGTMGMRVGRDFDEAALPEGRLELAYMRQIAFEVLSTIHEVPDFRDYADPSVLPRDQRPQAVYSATSGNTIYIDVTPRKGQ